MPADPALPTGPRSLVRPDRAGGRLTRSPGLLAALAARLTARDRWLLRMLHEHRVLTTTHITQLAFGTTRAATARLLALYQLRAIDRFRPLAAVRVRAAAFRPRRSRRLPAGRRGRHHSWPARLPPRPGPGHRPVGPARPCDRDQLGVLRAGRPGPPGRERRPDVLVVRTAVRRVVG